MRVSSKGARGTQCDYLCVLSQVGASGVSDTSCHASYTQTHTQPAFVNDSITASIALSDPAKANVAFLSARLNPDPSPLSVSQEVVLMGRH